MRTHMLRLTMVLAVSGLVLAGCGGPGPDGPDGGGGGDDDGGADDGARDGGDSVAPRVVATTPADGATLVPVDTALSIAFSEPMDVGAGTLTAETDDGPVALSAPTWNDDGTTLTIAPAEALAPGAEVTVTVDASFRDLAGNALEPELTFTFATEDATAPTIVRATPVEGATVSTALDRIEIELSEPMAIALGRARLVGPGAPTLGAVSWLDRVASWSVTGLLAESSYELVLEGFTDVAGNALDASSLGTDGALDFTTGDDTIAPVVIGSAPNEGQLDVDVGLITRVELTFSEPMDTALGALSLEVDGTSVPLTATWDRDGRRVLADVSGRLAIGAAHRVVLSGFADLAGNALDGTVRLGDGVLDFTTGADRFVPFVAWTVPADGDLAAPAATDRVSVVFSEAMDTSRTTATLRGDGRDVVLSGTWSAGDTVLTLDAPMLQGGRSYTIDLAGFTDAGGTPIDPTHPYLADGIASFGLAAPTGERCGDSLTQDQATVAAGVTTWTLAPDSVIYADGSSPCDPDGHSADAVVRYRKTTPASSASGGRALHIRVQGATSADLDVDVLRDACRPTASTASAARLRCMPDRNVWETWLDVGAGDYFIWVAQEEGAPFLGATVTVEEVAAVREGESCDAPFTTTTGAAIYTAPATSGAPHRWEVPLAYASAPDRGVSPTGAGAFECSDLPMGHDAVIRFEKSTDTSLVTVRVALPSAPSSEDRDTVVEVARGCDPVAPGYDALQCVHHTGPATTREWTIDGPAGPLSTWIAGQRTFPLPRGEWSEQSLATIEVTELEPGPGDTCATAIPLTAGTTNLVSATRPFRAHAPSCLPSGGVTWFRYTPTQGLGVLRANGATNGAVLDRASGAPLRCSADDVTAGLPVFGVAGQEVCIALSSSATVTQITIEEIPYSGVRGIESAHDLVVPTGVSSPGTQSWMAVLGDRLFRSGPGRIQVVPTGGGALAQQSYTGLTSDGGGAVARPDGLYVLSSSNSATSGPRLFRVTDAAGAFLETPVALEVLPTGFSYPDRAFDALAWDGTRFLAATGQATSANTNPTCCTPVYFYAIPADGSAPVEIGTNDIIDDVSAIAADATYLYVIGRISTGTIVDDVSHYDEALFRLRRDQLGDPAQAPVVLVNGYDFGNDNGAVYVDDTGDADVLYVQLSGNTSSGHGSNVLVVIDPDADAPRWVGPLWRAPSRTASPGLAYDGSIPALWLLEPSTNPDRWIRLD